MNPHDIKTIIRYVETNCAATITPEQTIQLCKIRNLGKYGKYNIVKLRTLYRIAIANFVYPQCPYCKEPIMRQGDLSIDHIIPKAHGGTDDISNLQPMHRGCNCDKGDTIPKTNAYSENATKKDRHNHNKPKHKERDTVVKGRTPEELYKKCRKIDRMLANQCHNATHGYSK